MKKIVLPVAFTLLQVCLFIGNAFAQTPPPSSSSVGAPLDVLAGVLLAAGAGYGIKRIKDKA